MKHGDQFQAKVVEMKYPVLYADAFAAATAEKLRAILVTGAPEMADLKGVLPIEPLE